MLAESTARTRLLLGDAAVQAIESAHICIIGLGGVGSYAAEALARAGVGALTLMDGDTVAQSNCNRQLCALTSTIGQPKAEVLARRIADINPQCRITALPQRYTGTELDLSQFTYICDAIDSVSDKCNLIEQAVLVGVPILSCMGAGNKLDPMQFRVTDLEKTAGCPLAKTMRLAMRKRGIRKVKVVFSPEPPTRPIEPPTDGTRPPIGSVPWVPGAAGLLMAGTILQEIAAQSLQPPIRIQIEK